MKELTKNSLLEYLTILSTWYFSLSQKVNISFHSQLSVSLFILDTQPPIRLADTACQRALILVAAQPLTSTSQQHLEPGRSGPDYQERDSWRREHLEGRKHLYFQPAWTASGRKAFSLVTAQERDRKRGRGLVTACTNATEMSDTNRKLCPTWNIVRAAVNTTSEGSQNIKHIGLFLFSFFSLCQDNAALSQTHTRVFALYNGETALHTGP